MGLLRFLPCVRSLIALGRMLGNVGVGGRAVRSEALVCLGFAAAFCPHAPIGCPLKLGGRYPAGRGGTRRQARSAL